MKCITCFLSWQVVEIKIIFCPPRGVPLGAWHHVKTLNWSVHLLRHHWLRRDQSIFCHMLRREHTLNIFIWLPSLLWHFELIHLDFSLIWASKFILVQQLLTFSSKLSHFLSFLHTITEVWIFDEDVDDDIDDKFSIFGI